MKTLNEWLDAYGESHQNKTNRKIHVVCVPLIMFSLFGLLWTIPKPSVFVNFHFINWATLFYMGGLIFYTRLDKVFSALMAVIAGVMLLGVFYLSKTEYLIEVSVVIFVVSWIGQFIGHKIEGAKPSFFEDLQFLLIGPLWVLNELKG
ncbi:MAG: DUF962 domain-containing protein [Bdellovibrionales bacterium]